MMEVVGLDGPIGLCCRDGVQEGNEGLSNVAQLVCEHPIWNSRLWQGLVCELHTTCFPPTTTPAAGWVHGYIAQG